MCVRASIRTFKGQKFSGRGARMVARLKYVERRNFKRGSLHFEMEEPCLVGACFFRKNIKALSEAESSAG